MRANLKSITHRCHLFEVAFVWELTKKTSICPWVASRAARNDDDSPPRPKEERAANVTDAAFNDGG